MMSSAVIFGVSFLFVLANVCFSSTPEATPVGFQGPSTGQSTDFPQILQQKTAGEWEAESSLFEIIGQFLSNHSNTAPQHGTESSFSRGKVGTAPTSTKIKQRPQTSHGVLRTSHGAAPLRQICILGRCLNFSLPFTRPRQCFPSQCGRPLRQLSPPSSSIGPSKKIVGGTRAELFSHPWTAMIAKREDGRTFFCGGTVICAHWVLTVAHCMNQQTIVSPEADLDPAFYTIYIGRHAGWHEKFGPQVQVFEGRRGILSMLQHELFIPGVSRGVITNDIALVRLRRPIIFNQYAQPACLAATPPAVGEVLWATGWGNTFDVGPDNSALKQIAVRIHDDAVCDAGVAQFSESDTSGLLCAGGERNQDTCIGDSGGPLVGWRNTSGTRTWILFGLTNLGSQSCNTSPSNQQPSLYINISHFLPWIQRHTRSCCV